MNPPQNILRRILWMFPNPKIFWKVLIISKSTFSMFSKGFFRRLLRFTIFLTRSSHFLVRFERSSHFPATFNISNSSFSHSPCSQPWSFDLTILGRFLLRALRWVIESLDHQRNKVEVGLKTREKSSDVLRERYLIDPHLHANTSAFQSAGVGKFVRGVD